MRVKLLQFGDLHIDAPFTSLSDIEGIPSQRRQELRMALARLVDLADSENADLVLVCGDLYEHGYTGKSSIHYICDQFSKISRIPVLIIPGNHDPKLAGSYYTDHEWPSNVHILGSTDVFECGELRARIYGGADHSAVDPAFINILMHHGTLDMPFSTDAFQPISSRKAEEGGFDYCALGHFHSTICGAGAEGIFYNAGSPEPLGFDEEGDHGAFLTEIEKEPGKKASINPKFINICSRRFINMSADIGGSLTNEQAAEIIAAEMGKAGQERDLYRITIVGHIPTGIMIDTGEITRQLANKANYLKIINNTMPDYDLAQLSREHGLRGLFTRKMMEKVSSAVDDESGGMIIQALYYGLEAIDEGKVCI